MNAVTPRRIVIAGGGTAGWMAAAALTRTLGRTATVTLVESDAIGTVGVGESTIPPLITFNRLLGINEAEFMAATQATFKLGIQFDGWKGPDDSYFHAFGLTGKDHWAAGFQHFWLDGQARGHTESYDDYCLELVAARDGKFAHLPDDRMSYAYQLDSTLYGRFLRRMAEGDGATRIEGKIARVDLDGESGDIAALVLDGGTRVEGDLFLDCTGFRALLIEQALHVGYDDWTHWLPCDAAIAVQTESVRPPVPFTRAMAHDAGWQWRIPLQHRTGNGHVYASRFVSDEAAAATLLEHLDTPALGDPRPVRFRPGKRHRAWDKNVVALGLAGGFLEPLESTSIHLIQTGILRLIALFPGRGFNAADTDEYNRQTDFEYRDVRDFIIAHYKVTAREDTEFWRYLKHMPVPDSLTERLELFRSSGRFFMHAKAELFREESWVQVLLGQGLHAHHDPMVDMIPAEHTTAFLKDVEDVVADVAAGLPTHEAFIARHCQAPKVG